MTFGEDRVRVKFNPSDNSLVSQIEQKSAELIDLCSQIENDANLKPSGPKGEIARLCRLAQTHYEDAAMWAVKAATA